MLRRGRVRGVELVVLLALTMGVVGLAGRLPEQRAVKRDLARRRLDSIGTLSDGKEVTLRGTVCVADAELTAPETGRRCVYWRVTRGGAQTQQGVPFELDTAEGRIRVVAIAPRLGVHAEGGEQVVAVGAEVTLHGICTFEPDPTRDDLDGMYRGGKRPTRPVISGSRKVRLLIG